MTTDVTQLDQAALEKLESELSGRYTAFKDQQLALDMTRGKPSAEQLDLARDLLTLPGADDFRAASGLDCRNYGVVDGPPEVHVGLAEAAEVDGIEVRWPDGEVTLHPGVPSSQRVTVRHPSRI